MSRGVQQARCDYCGRFGLCQESPSGRYLECVDYCACQERAVAPGGQGCVRAYEKAYAEAQTRNLRPQAAHEIGLFAVYLHGKGAASRNLASECPACVAGRIENHQPYCPAHEAP